MLDSAQQTYSLLNWIQKCLWHKIAFETSIYKEVNYRKIIGETSSKKRKESRKKYMGTLLPSYTDKTLTWEPYTFPVDPSSPQDHRAHRSTTRQCLICMYNYTYSLLKNRQGRRVNS